MEHQRIYSQLRADVLARHFALGKFWRANLFTNVNILGEFGDCFLPLTGQKTTRRCFTAPCLPRRSGEPIYETPGKAYEMITGLPVVERWRIWNHDRTNALAMSGLRLIQLSVEHRLGHPAARKLIGIILETTAALFKYPEDSDFGGYILRWDPVADDDWELEIDEKGVVTPTVPCRFLINSDLKNADRQRYLYCTPLDDPRYLNAVKAGIAVGEIGGGQDRFRRWEPSKDEYVGLLVGLRAVFDAFSNSSDPADQNIVATVRSQTRRIAKYLQRFGYLLVRPCKGVTTRGCGEVLPLLEFAFNRVFQHILGEPFESTVKYIDALAEAGIRPVQLVGTARLTKRKLVIQALESVRDAFAQIKGPAALLATSLLGQLNTTQQRELASLWTSRHMIDAADIEMQGEVLLGYVFNCTPRQIRKQMFEAWLSKTGMEVADSFKPYLALMVLDDEDDFVRRNYLAWYEGTFNPAPTPSLATDGIDWALAGAVAMMVAHQQGDTVRHARFAMTLETHLGEMAKEILDLNEVEDDDDPVTLLTVAGAGASPLQHEEMKDEIGLSCGARSPRKLASEFHDKVGDWYGYMSTLALAWRHLLDGFNNPFTSVSGIVLPNLDTLNGWPEPKVPAAVIAEARLLPQRLLLPRRAISRSNPRPDGSADVALFVDPPARDVDNNVGHPPAPKGEISAFDFRGGLSRRVLRNDFPYPPLGEASPESDSWSQAPSFDFEENTLVERWDSQIDDTGLHLIVTLRAAELQWVPWRWGLWYPRFVLARLRGTVSLAWARQT